MASSEADPGVTRARGGIPPDACPDPCTGAALTRPRRSRTLPVRLPPVRPVRAETSVVIIDRRRPYPLAWALGVLLALLAAPAAAQDPYPRLGLYGHVDGRGAPLILANGQIDPVLLEIIARRHVVVLDATPFTEYRPDALAALRLRRSSIKLLGYLQAQYIFRSAQPDSNVNLPTRIRILVRNLDGFLFHQNGLEYDTANINLAKKNGQGRFVVAEALADFFVDHVLVAGGWNGLFLDRFCTSLSWMQTPSDSTDYVRAGYPSFVAFDAAWFAATDTLANRMRRRAGNTPIFIGNCGQGNKYAAFNGWMRENFPLQNGGTWETNMFRDPGGYLFEQPLTRSPYAGWMTSWPTDNVTPYSSENMRRARFALGSAALGDGLGTLNPPNIDPTTGYMTWWYDEYSVDCPSGISTAGAANTGWLGRAQGPSREMIWLDPAIEDAGGLDPGFEVGLSPGWVFTTSNSSTFTHDLSTAAVGAASARVTIPASAGTINSAVVTSTGTVFYLFGTYAATFWARASTPRTIGVIALNANTGQPYEWLELAIDTTWRQYRVKMNGQLGTAKIQFRVGGTTGSVWLDDVHFQRGAPSIHRRDFDYGVVLVNPGSQPLNVSMERNYRRLIGLRDPAVNDGSVASLVRVEGSDAVFLLRTLPEIVGVDDPPAGDGAGAGGPPLAWSTPVPVPARAGAEPVRLVLSLGAPGAVTVDVHDPRGRRVRRLHAGPLAAGRHAFAWDGLDEAGRAAPPGVYFVRALAATGHASRKVVVR